MTLYVLVDFIDENIEFSARKWQVVLDENLPQESLKLLNLRLEQIQAYLSQGHEVWLILSAKVCSFYQVQLPKLSKKDIIPAIGSVLEDGLTQAFDDYHCFYQVLSSSKNLVLQVGLIDTKLLTDIMYQWQSSGITISGTTIDWFALNNNEFLLLPDGHALAATETIKGFIFNSLLKQTISAMPTSTIFFSFNSSEPFLENANLIELDFPMWLLKRLKSKGLFDISMRKKHFDFLESMPRGRIEFIFIRACISLFALSLLATTILFIKNSIEYFNNKKIMSTFTEQATDDLEQKLHIYQSHQAQKNKFWGLFIAIQKAMLPGIRIENLNYDQGKLKFALSASDMSVLQQFKRRLMQARLAPQESQVLVEKEGIKATIELRVHP